MSNLIRKIEMAGVMSVQDLIDTLEDIDDKDASVFISCDYGDRSHTQQLLAVETVEETTELGIDESCYSHTGLARGPEAVAGLDDGELDVVILVT